MLRPDPITIHVLNFHNLDLISFIFFVIFKSFHVFIFLIPFYYICSWTIYILSRNGSFEAVAILSYYGLKGKRNFRGKKYL